MVEARWNKGYHHPIIVSIGAFIWIIILGTSLYNYANEKEVFPIGFAVTILGLLSFLKAKTWMIKNKKLFSMGCDDMPQLETYFYFGGYILMILGFILSFKFW